MIRSTEEFRSVVKAARRVSTPLVAVRTADPASAITQVCAGANGKQDSPPLGENSPAIDPGDALAVCPENCGRYHPLFPQSEARMGSAGCSSGNLEPARRVQGRWANAGPRYAPRFDAPGRIAE